MQAVVSAYYEIRNNGVSAEWKRSVHVPPHLHEAVEIVYVTEGTLELGMGPELYHMEKGDLGIVFPNVIHHYQAFGTGKNQAVYLFVEPSLLPAYSAQLQKYSPKDPIMKKEQVHEDIVNAVNFLVHRKEQNPMLIRAYVQIIFAYVFFGMKMMDKSAVGSDDLIYNAVEYVAKNFREEFTLETMAYDLGVSKYVLSRMFTKTFHCNFNRYVNGIRLNHVSSALENTQESITNICFDCGFESQRTFNRVFRERYKMTPREYRKRKAFHGDGEYARSSPCSPEPLCME